MKFKLDYVELEGIINMYLIITDEKTTELFSSLLDAFVLITRESVLTL